jgi:NAD(P)-dependent dehydrogenase (short-subunit alcohol dehydrogenase family)
MGEERRVALVTGASRGIGKSIAQRLARAGYDVAITARTAHDGERREHSSTVRASNTEPLPGSLDATAGLVEAEGRAALAVPADLLDFASLGAAVARVEERWGRIDVLVNNGRYIGPGHMDRLLDTPVDLLERQLQANVLAPLVLCRLVLPGMVARGGGTVVNITSSAGYGDPLSAAGQGGWGVGYGISKAGLHRIAGFLLAEHGADGVRAYNVQPGFVATERMAADMGEFGFVGGAPPDVVGAVVAWLVEHPAEAPEDGRTVEAQHWCHRLGLVPEWPGPTAATASVRHDLSGARAAELEQALREAM